MAAALKPKTIFRTASRENPYAQIVRTMLQDDKISLEAAGLLGFVLSLPDDWVFNLKWLCSKRNIGRDKAQRIVRELIDRGYCARDQERGDKGRHAPVEYRFSDDPAALSPRPDFQVAVAQDVVSPRPCLPAPVEPRAVNPHLHINSQSIKTKIQKARGTGVPTASQGTDSQPAQTLPFTAGVLTEVARLGVDVDKLFARYEARTKGRCINDPSAYLLQMARDEAAKRLGVTAEQVKGTTSKNRSERIQAATEATAAFSRPSDGVLARVRNCKHLADILAILARQKFKTQAACDKAFEGEVTNARFRPPGRSLLSGTSLLQPKPEKDEAA